MKPALLVIDLQKAWYNAQSREGMDGAAALLNHLVPLFVAKGYPVYYIQHQNPGAGVVPGSEGFEWIDAIQPGDAPVFIKSYGNAFNKTGLYEAIQRDGVDTLVLGGYRAENCVLSTYRGAQDLDLVPMLLKGAVAGPMAERVAFVEAMSDVVSLGALKRLLEL